MSDSDACASGSADCHFTCPSGGTWYVCPDEPYFVGCCSSDPCSNTNTTSPCPNVYPAAFESSIFDQIRPNTCLDSDNSNWFTCNFTSPPFLGCCSSNPCATTDGCPVDDVLPAAWSSSRDDQYQLFLDEGNGDDDDDDDSSGLSGGAIAGIVVGAVAAVVIILAAWWFLRRRRQKSQAQSTAIPPGEPQRMYTGEYAYQSPNTPYQPSSSPYQDSHLSPDPTGAKYPSGSSAGFSMPSPPLPSENGRPISEMYSQVSSEEGYSRQGGAGLNIHNAAAKPPVIQELDDTQAPAKPEVHELDGLTHR
ncbi:hypothetical protein BJY04DRAFT_195117 [Aspergillus karnatakaensis]|uniref:uncharacterized protein n=1 Tax=Aspergillus karnatakaensis TaxID=1810916 RepID=UPI003CCDD698